MLLECVTDTAGQGQTLRQQGGGGGNYCDIRGHDVTTNMPSNNDNKPQSQAPHHPHIPVHKMVSFAATL